MITNKALLNKRSFLKAMKALPDITLLPEEADKFIDYVVDQSFWKNNARIVKMEKVEKNLRYLGFKAGTRFLKPANKFAASDYLKEFAEGKVTLQAQKVRGAVVIYDDDLEEGIEGQAFADHLMKIIAKKVANEIDEASYCSHPGFADTDIRSLWEGFRYRLLYGFLSEGGREKTGTFPKAATILDASNSLAGHDSDFAKTGKIAERIKVDTTYTGDWEFKFSKMLAVMPSRYKLLGLKNLRFFCNDIIPNDYAEALATRATILGDKALLGENDLPFRTVPIASVPLMPITYQKVGAVGSTLGREAYEGDDADVYADAILTPKNNFIIGIQKELTLESKRAPEDQAQYVFYNLKIDIAVENPEAAVILVNVTHG